MAIRRLLASALVMGAGVLACAFPGGLTPEPSARNPSTIESAQETEAPAPTAAPAHSRPILWMCDRCGGDQAWVLGEGEPHLQTLPIRLTSFYGFSAAAEEILFAAYPPSGGAGPGNVSVSDLSVLNLTTGLVTTLFSDDVVEARWAPNGVDLAYILATPSTYELHWRDAEGGDQVLARDVTFNWSIAPSSEAIAFTRESGYELDISPGLYVVSVLSGEEVLVAEVDAAGRGSISDAPIWSPDSREVIFPLWATGESRLILAQADGRGSVDLAIDPELAANWWAVTAIPQLLWSPDGEWLVGSPAISHDPFGPSPILRYRLERSTALLRDIRVVAEAGSLVMWADPGRSVYYFDGGGEMRLLSVE